MPITETQWDYATIREQIRGIRPPFLLRAYEASPDDYERITDEDFKCEFVDGELIVHSPASLHHEALVMFVGSLLREFVASRGLGHVFGSNAVMQIGERRFSPDVSFLRKENASRIQGGRVHGPMDLAVEIISVSTRSYDHDTKVPAYREAGVTEIWLIDAERRQFEVHARRGEDYTTQTMATGRWASTAIPGLAIEVDWLWTEPLPPIAACNVG